MTKSGVAENSSLAHHFANNMTGEHGQAANKRRYQETLCAAIMTMVAWASLVASFALDFASLRFHPSDHYFQLINDDSSSFGVLGVIMLPLASVATTVLAMTLKGRQKRVLLPFGVVSLLVLIALFLVYMIALGENFRME